MTRDQRLAALTLIAHVAVAAPVGYVLCDWLGWRFTLGLLVGALGDTLLYGLVLLRFRLGPPPADPTRRLRRR